MTNIKFSGIIISYHGNINGREPDAENRLSYIKKALDAGWHVCVDVLFRHGGFFLPHTGGFDPIPAPLLAKQRMWCNALNAPTLDALCNVNAHCFFMGAQPYSLTSAQFIWTLPENILVDRSVAVFPELADPRWLLDAEPAGICSNEPAKFLS